MKRHLKLRAALVAGCLVTLVVVGFAAAQTAPKVGSGDVVTDRHRLMKLNGASWADAQAKFKAGNIEAIAVNAETMAIMEVNSGCTQEVSSPCRILTNILQQVARSCFLVSVSTCCFSTAERGK